jgi:peptide/nickel transport system permease protein
MQRYIARRLIQAVPILIGISFISFMIVVLAPGDPLNALYPDYILRQMDQDKLRDQLGLNDSLPMQYLNMMGKLLTGDLDSFVERRPVVEMVVEKLPATGILAGFTLLISTLVSIPVAIFSATHRESWMDAILDVVSLLGISMPSFLVALVLLLFLSERWHLLPSSGLRPIGSDTYNLVTMAPYLVMPVGVMSMLMLPALMRYARAGMIEAMREDYVRTARAKGLSERRVIYRHALRNALLPVVTEVGLLIPMLLGGTAITETIFGIPGLGRLAVKSAIARDYPVILTINLYVAGLTILSGILTDVAYSVLDPRIRQG